MNTPSNYKELEEFAKSINLDVKYLLGEKYEGSLYLNSLTSLPENFNVTVGGNIDLSSLKTLPENFNVTVGGNLWLDSVTSLPKNFNVTVGGSLDLNSLKTLPENFNVTVGGSLWLNSLKTLPENFNVTVGGTLDLNSLKTLPENFNVTVGGNLWLYSLKTLPENFNVTVGENLWLNSLKTLPENYKINLKGELYINAAEVFTKVIYNKIGVDRIITFEGTNYILVDGIFCEVIQNHEGIKKCRKINSTKEFYIVSSNGKHSHGETIKEARKDLIYKITNRDKSSYKGLKSDSKLSFGEAVECYRVITGACFFGTKNFIETYKVPEKDYTINEIIKLTSNQYGGSTFKEFFQNT